MSTITPEGIPRLARIGDKLSKHALRHSSRSTGTDHQKFSHPKALSVATSLPEAYILTVGLPLQRGSELHSATALSGEMAESGAALESAPSDVMYL